MNRISRLYSRPAAALVVLMVLTSGCLVVVEKDDDHRRDRHRHLYSEWTVDIIVYRTETFAASDRSVNITFDEAGTFVAQTTCGELTGSFDVNDSNGFTVGRVNSDAIDSSCTSRDRTVELFRDALFEARSYDADESELRIASADDGMIALSAR